MNYKSYMKQISRKLGLGSTEKTHRPALQNFLESWNNDIEAVNDPEQVECGAPDFHIYRNDKKVGFLECKALNKDLDKIETTEQLQRYRQAVPNLLLTNYLEFRWYVEGEYRTTVRPFKKSGDKIKEVKGERKDYKRMLNGFLNLKPPLVEDPQILAEKMAAIAESICYSLDRVYDLGDKNSALHKQLEAFRDVLLPSLDVDKFADMYAQTITYGLFSARLNIDREHFDRHTATSYLPQTNPFLRKLFGQILGLDLHEGIDLWINILTNLLKNTKIEVIKDKLAKGGREDPVIYFYETFLNKYDPKKRSDRGVFFTREPIANFIVKSINSLLKSKFNRLQGLADEDTYLLDPAVGTGTFLYHTIKQVYGELKKQGQLGDWQGYVKEAILERIFGFELLMAPYAVGHMKLSILLDELGYNFKEGKRLGIYLTNTLEESMEKSLELPFASYIEEEANAVQEIKQDYPIMVVLGNPPYSGHSENDSEWINEMMEKGYSLPNGGTRQGYFEVDGHKLQEKNPKWLRDDYKKFIRFGQWRVDQTGHGILAYVTNHGYIDDILARGMRQSLMKTFDEIYILDLHGSAVKRESTPEGGVDENVFDISPGVAISLMVKKRNSEEGDARVWYKEKYGNKEEKFDFLKSNAVDTVEWGEEVSPQGSEYYFISQDKSLRDQYKEGVRLTEIMPTYRMGIVTGRNDFAIEYDRSDMESKIRDFLNSENSDEEVRERYFGTESSNDLPPGDKPSWKMSKQRKKIQEDEDWESKIRPYSYRVFDQRYIFYHPEALERDRRGVMKHMLKGENLGLITCRQTVSDSWQHAFVTDSISDDCLLSTKSRERAYIFPLYLYPENAEGSEKASIKRSRIIEETNRRLREGIETGMFTLDKQGTEAEVKNKIEELFPKESYPRWPNIHYEIIMEIREATDLDFSPLEPGNLREDFGPEDILNYFYAVLYAPIHRHRYGELMGKEFPRIPLPNNKEFFREMSTRGSKLVQLHLMRDPALKELRTTFPESGDKIVKSGYPKYEEPTNDQKGRVYINQEQYFEGITEEFWQYHIGGYQVLKKWLKERKFKALSHKGVKHYQKIVRAIEETIEIQEELDNYFSS